MNRFAAVEVIERAAYFGILIDRLRNNPGFEDNAALLIDLEEYVDDGDIEERRMMVPLVQIQASPRLSFQGLTDLMRNRIWWTPQNNMPDADDGIPSVIIVNQNEVDLDGCLLVCNAAWGRNNVVMASVSLGEGEDQEIGIFAQNPEHLRQVLYSVIMLAARTPNLHRNNGVLSIEGYVNQETPVDIRNDEVLQTTAFLFLLQRVSVVKLQFLFLTIGTQDMLLRYSSNTRFEFDRCQFENGGRRLIGDQQFPEGIVVDQWVGLDETYALNEFLTDLLDQRYITRPRRRNAHY
mmetsp:Transcript_44709/g.50125  ORF Transcript_44709/g.50125 Transcript_44709/m.50125 type:complete len:293 (+) Transcript_44709:149-1027(+)|eukprot:CAMPEP_0170817438 /NCGR_PEP_ID=MMETSP0733-20121128/40020_1 /TAXON_ID=186038 /ORGANISM="Fragilariopsis kerguelensis, Strain L26-C5" /LENGTH=292 /DNA_ID=CAMNT_0011177119 /DNA_START=71 /DNA_END=949 /DNA_ORIENTATION=-